MLGEDSGEKPEVHHGDATLLLEAGAFLLCGGAARLTPSRRVREYVQLSLVFPVLHGHSELATHS
jgi:hypothetical protein